MNQLHRAVSPYAILFHVLFGDFIEVRIVRCSPLRKVQANVGINLFFGGIAPVPEMPQYPVPEEDLCDIPWDKTMLP